MNINATLLGQMITFALFIGVTMRYIWPQVMAAMEARRAEIQKGLQDAAQGREIRRLAEEEGSSIVATAQADAKSLLAEAHERVRELMDQASKDAEVKKNHIVAEGHKQLQIDQETMRGELMKEIATMVLSISKHVLGGQLDAKAHEQLVKQYLDEK